MTSTTPGAGALRAALTAIGGDLEPGPEHGLVRVVSPSGDSVVLALLYGPKGAIPPAAIDTLEIHDSLLDTAGSIVVADQLPAATRQRLNDAAISWFDRRGHLRIVAGPIWIDTDTPSAPRPRSSARTPPAVSGRAQISLAAAYLLGEGRPGIRDLARQVGLSPTAISKARAALIAAGLLNAGPAIPELFWALADAWAPSWTALARVPGPADGLAATGTLAAIELGVGLAAVRWPVELLGASEHLVEAACLRCGVADDDGACRIAVAPTPLATANLTGLTVADHPVARPLFVALELAQDPARGAEALDSWNPPGTQRVW